LPHSPVSTAGERPEPPPSEKTAPEQEAPTVFREGGRNGRVHVEPSVPTPKSNAVAAVQKARALRKEWLATYGAYGDADWDNKAFLWIAEQENGTFENIQYVYGQLQ